ncbi:MAG: LamG-like jellyroll fold domain-containing protein [Planctomycetota bacterium]
MHRSLRLLMVFVLVVGGFGDDFAFASFPDSSTVGLWLFDEADYPHTTLTDASEYEKADLCLMDGGSIVAGQYGNALRVSPGDWAVCYAGFAGKVPEEHLREPDGTPSGLWGPTEGSGPLLYGLAGSTWTIELWLNLSSGGSGISIIDLGWAYDPGLSLTLNGSSLVLVDYYAGVQLSCPTSLSTGAWQHVAFTYNGSTARHFVNGVEQAAVSVSAVSVQPVPDLQIPLDREHEHRGFDSMSYEQRRQNRFNFAVGTDRHANNPMTGKVDEMRISNVVRYTGSFTPESLSRNYGSGALEPSVANGLPLLFDPAPVSMPLEIGGRKHVFIDAAVMETMSDLQITMNQPYDKQEITKDFVIAKSAWRPSVFDVNGVVYLAMPEGYSSNTGTTYLATSPDGLDFTMQGPIIIDTPMYGSFFKDLNPNVRPEEQYKVNAFVGNRGMYMYISGDGVNWRRNETIQLPLRSGGEGECFWDDQRGRYASYIKRDSSFDDPECADASGRVAPGFWSDEILKAWPFYHMVTPYFEGYPFPSVTCEGPVEFDSTGAGQVYRTRAIKYPWAPDVYLAFIWRYGGDDGPRHVDLGIGRDGENWSFFGTNWYIPLGSAEEELSLYGLIRRGDEIWQYVDEGGAHGGSDPRHYYRYRQRLDGFVSLDAGGATGTATTLPIAFDGKELALNVKATGSVKVGIIDDYGIPVPGYGLGDCDPIVGDAVERVVTWNGDANVGMLAHGAVQLQFEMQNAKLYAFQFIGGPLPRGDYDGNGVVDWKDLRGFGDYWLSRCRPSESYCYGRDINHDYKVNFEDFCVFALDWAGAQQ